jgi:prepilin-type N-terminal cleavage/methylation domain-containing protein
MVKIGGTFMKNKKVHAGGFTLIELLVVVVIICILVAIALPQYLRATERAYATQIIPLVKSVADAENRYYLANREYTTDFNLLDIKLSGTSGYVSACYGWGYWTHGYKNYEIMLSKNNSVIGHITKGKYKYSGFEIYFLLDDSQKPAKLVPDKLYCTENHNVVSEKGYCSMVGYSNDIGGYRGIRYYSDD